VPSEADLSSRLEDVLGHLERYAAPGRLLVVGPGSADLVAAADRRGWTPTAADGAVWPPAAGDGELDAVAVLTAVGHLPHIEDLVAAAASAVRPDGALAVVSADGGRSKDGLSRLLRRHGFVACGWHPAGTGACVYARRVEGAEHQPVHRPARVPDDPADQASVETAILEELGALGRARRYCDWLFAQFGPHVRGSVAEVGAGIGTFSERILERGVERLLLVEPEPMCAAVLERRFASEPTVELVRDFLPEAPSLTPTSRDLVVCQNVLEHVSDDRAAVATMARSLRPGGMVALIVPAGPKLYGPLDEAYGHRRRYTAGYLSESVRSAGLSVESLHHMNQPGVPAWWLNNRRRGARISERSLRVYEQVVRVARPLEARFRPPFGLSLVCLGRRPGV
jgi:2-polyprenyl-3-methyl-5-hydroxy-6-metoxy-1,4-benzoquinol methylase